MKIAIVAPSCSLDPSIPARLEPLAAARGVSLHFHPQCFLSEGHFAGPDAARVAALVDVANDPAFDAIWFARGGYGACRVAENALVQFGPAARNKAYLGYSDAGFLLAGLYARAIGRPVHAPMPSDLNRAGGESAVARVLDWFAGQSPRNPERQAAFNLTVLSQLLGTPLQPDLTDHTLMIEEVGEYMYRIDRSLFHLTSNPAIRGVKGLMLGRCSDIPENNPDFILDEEAITRHWCAKAGIPYLGRANIGHDIHNAIIPFGAAQ